MMPQEWSARTIDTLQPSTSWEPPMFIAEQLSTPFDSSQWQISKFATTAFGRCSLQISTASPMWSKWAWVTSTASRRSKLFSSSGQEGLFPTQGSMRTTSPPGRSHRTVAWPR